MNYDDREKRTIAAECLDAFLSDDLDDASMLLARIPPPHTPALRTVALLAKARRCEAADDVTGAQKAFDELNSSGVPFPSVLEACATHFTARGRVADALSNAVTLDLFESGALRRHARKMVKVADPKLLVTNLAHNRGRPYVSFGPKRALIERFGIDAAIQLYARLLSPAIAFGARPVRLEFLSAYAARSAADFVGSHPVRPVTTAASPVVGGGAPASTHLCRASFTATLRDVIVMSKSNYMLCGDAAVLDCHEHELTLCPINYDLDPMIFRDAPPGPEEAPALLAFTARKAGELRRVDKAFSLLGIHTHAFGHMITEFLPKLWSFMDRPDFASVTVLVDKHIPRQHLEAIQMFLAPDQPVLQVDYGQQIAVGELLVAPMPIYMPAGPKPGLGYEPPVQIADVEAYAPLLRRAAERLPVPCADQYPERIFLSRKPHQHRKMLNQADVVRHLAGRGFVSVDFGDLTFATQMAMIRSARIVLGADGSSLSTTLLARPGTRVGRLMHSFTDDPDWYAHLSHALGQRVLVLSGETVNEHPHYQTFSDYRISLDRLDDLVDALEVD